MSNYAKSSKGRAVRRLQYGADIENDVALTDHLRMSSEFFIGSRIWNNKEIVSQEGLRAKRLFPLDRPGLHAPCGLTPLSSFVDEVEQGNWRLQQTRGDPGNGVEMLLCRGVKNPEHFECS